MAKPFMLYNPSFTCLDNTGIPVNGGLLFVYQAGTTTKVNTYNSSSLSVANPNPITLNSAGRPSNNGAEIELWTNQAVKLVLAPSTDTDPPQNPIWIRDNLTTLGQTVTMVTKTSNYTVVSTDRDVFFECDASGGSFNINLISSANAGNGFRVLFKKIDNSANTVTITANAAETIDGSNTYVLSSLNQSLDIVNDGTQWQSLLPVIYTAPTVKTKTTTYAVQAADNNTLIECNATAATFGIALPSTTIAGSGFMIQFKKTDSSANVISISTTGGANIDGNSSYTLSNQYQTLTLKSDGTNWLITSSYNGIVVEGIEQVITATGTTTFVCPANITRAYIEVWGSGGSGGGATTSGIAGGGAAGGYAAGYVAVTPGNSYTITIATGGASIPSNTASAGNNGSNSSFGSALVATGGNGGSSTVSGASSLGGVGSTGTTLLNGGGGSPGTGSITGGGSGGVAPILGVPNVYFAGQTAVNYANGGNGGNSSTASGAGGNGLCRIRY